MPYTVVKEFDFAAAHHIPDHPGKCRNLHGHNYRIRVHLAADVLDELGMVIDFARVKEVLRDVAGPFDHRVLNDFPAFEDVPPTAEAVSAHLYRGLRDRLDDGRVRVRRVEVWETPTSCAVYEP